MACKTPNLVADSSFCHWITWPRPAEHVFLLADTGRKPEDGS